jgi:hypothetical protein
MQGRAARTATADEARLRSVVRSAPGLTVVTGGQTGVDSYAAEAALRAGLAVQLVFPRSLRQEDGSLTPARRRRLTGAVVHELGSASFRYRTWTCAYLADAVLLLDPAGGAGCRETARAARRLGRPLLLAAEPDLLGSEQVTAWLAECSARVLLIAGCRASVLTRAGKGSSLPADLAEVMAGCRAWHERLVRDLA